MSSADIPPVIGWSIRYSLSRWDLLRCRLWFVYHHKVLLGFMFLTSLGVGLITIPAPAPGHVAFPVLFRVCYVVMTAGMAFCVMAVFQFGMQSVMLFANKNRGVIGDHEIEIRHEGLLERTSLNESLHRWSGFSRIAASSNYMYIFVSDNVLHYVPLRYFASKQDARAFIEEIRKRANDA